ncbi:MAG: hypothetical protein H7A53_08275 [Akkermansiaceae bacterium]|nr:hypothetical protein [Akkermansiaceae bacterium]
MLRITGELNPALGGLPAYPEINLEVALQPRMIQFSSISGQADPFEVFNKPNPNESWRSARLRGGFPTRRFSPQHDPMADRSICLFALRSLKEAGKSLESRIDPRSVLPLAGCRLEAESARLKDETISSDVLEIHASTKPGAVTYPTKITPVRWA